MSTEGKTKPNIVGLSFRTRALAIGFGGFLIFLGSLSYVPFIAVLLAQLIGDQWFTQAVYSKDADSWLPANLPITVLASGVLLVLFGLNGSAVASAKLPGGSEILFDSAVKSPEEAELDPEVKQEMEEGAAIAAPPGASSIPGGTRGGAPVSGQEQNIWYQGDYKYYKPSAVPGDVLVRFFSAQASSETKRLMPGDMDAVEYVYRKNNRGNPRWYFKMKGKEEPLVLVTGRVKDNKVVNE